MKTTFALFLLALSAPLAQAAGPDYVCECQDTGLECDGMERMAVTLDGRAATIEIGDSDWDYLDRFDTEWNSRYRPRTSENANFAQYRIKNDEVDGYQPRKSSFLIGNSILSGKKTGYVKFQAVSAENIGGGFWSWLFECEKR